MWIPKNESGDHVIVPSQHLLRPKMSLITRRWLVLPKVTLRSNESQEQLLRRFRKEVMKSKVLADVRRKRWFVSKSELDRIKAKKAARRARRVQRRQMR